MSSVSSTLAGSAESAASSANAFQPMPPRGGPRRLPRRTLRRRPTPEQGRALEILGHAIEYLADSELHTIGGAFSPDVSHAASLLMERSRAVFAECPEVVPVLETIREGLIRMFGRPALMLPPPIGAGYLRTDTLAR